MRNAARPNQFHLLRERRFAPFFCTQFLGAFNDNVHKNAVAILLAFHAAQLSSLSSNTLVNMSAGLFILPFFLFSATAGQLADKYEKSQLIRYTVMLEIVVMTIAAFGFYLQQVWLLLVALFLSGTQSAMFGPVKYAILPQHLRTEELIGGNGLVEMATFVAILLGTLLGGILIGMQPNGTTWVSITTISAACLGFIVSRGIPHSPAPAPALRINWNPLTETIRNIKFTRTNRTVFLVILGSSWFWFYGAMFVSQFPNLTKEVIGGNEQVVTLLLMVFSIGIGTGSLFCERLSGRKVEIGLVPFGSIGLTLFAIDLYFATRGLAPQQELIGAAEFLRQPQHWRLIADLMLIGTFGGFYIVPLYAMIQMRSDPEHRSRIIAGNNILNALFMVVAALLAIGLLTAGLTIPQLLLTTGVMNAVVAIYIYTLVPEFLMRFLVWLLVHSIYRLQIQGVENIPGKGAAVLVSNHVSFVDALVIAAASRRPVRFVMDHHVFRIPILNFVFRTSRAIPIASAKENPQLLERAYDEIAAALEAGELVGVFPEGRITDSGELYPFKSGIARIVERTPVPVVPLALRGLWGSSFSRKHGIGRLIPRKLFAKIELIAASPVAPAYATPESLQETVLGLRGDWK
ncbi:MAG: MFS transporter [Burkholderiales bacterium]|nr:MFS transporter [Pseudomonadota bacterium]